MEKIANKTNMYYGLNMKKIAVNIRMPVKMKELLEAMANEEFRSMNSLVLQLINERLRDKGIDWQEDTKKKEWSPTTGVRTHATASSAKDADGAWSASTGTVHTKNTHHT